MIHKGQQIVILMRYGFYILRDAKSMSKLAHGKTLEEALSKL